MGFVGDFLQWVAEFALHVLSTTGYLGLIALMAAESLVLPVPSEAVMPFAGVLVAQGRFSWLGAILASTLGSVLGSALGYLMGAYGLLPLVRKYGKYVLLHERHIDAAHAWFDKRGALAVFLLRFVPGVRHVSSVPAGSARMRFGPFLAATALGAGMWNFTLLYIGYRFGQDIAQFKPYLDLIGLLLIVALALYVVLEWRLNKRSSKDQVQPPLKKPPGL